MRSISRQWKKWVVPASGEGEALPDGTRREPSSTSAREEVGRKIGWGSSCIEESVDKISPFIRKGP